MEMSGSVQLIAQFKQFESQEVARICEEVLRCLHEHI
jgi:hypothetical protein